MDYWRRHRIMADKRRTRKANASCCDGESSREYHAVDISDPHHQQQGPRRRSASSSSSSRGESWMTKVTAAMSQRIFSGKKLGSSRSTQVMPLSETRGSSGGHPQEKQRSVTSSAYAESSGTKPLTLRQVSSENSLVHTTDVHSTPVEPVDFCPSVICDVASDDEDQETKLQQRQRHPSVVQTIQVKGSVRTAGQRKSAIEKIVPREQEHDEDFDFADTSSQRTRSNSYAAFPSRLVGINRERMDGEAVPVMQDTAPILKDFFSRNASTGQGIRVQQRESRRESLYKTSKQRQERLRKRIEDEQWQREAHLRQLKAEHLQKLNHQRRLRVRQEAASARRDLVSRLANDREMFTEERGRWEGEFEDEIRVLTRAFRKARANTTQLSGASGDCRPMTVAGLAVPEALSQIRRDASNYEKRLKTAAPKTRDWDFDRTPEVRKQTALLSEGSVCDIFLLEDSQEVLHASEDDCEEEEGAVGRDPDGGNGVAGGMSKTTIDDLLDERQSLLQRIADLEKLVQTQQESPKQPYE